jgi:hypothetical protein
VTGRWRPGALAAGRRLTRGRVRRSAARRGATRGPAVATFSFSMAAANVHTCSTMGHLPSMHSSEVILPIAIARPHEAAAYRTAMRGSLDRWAQQRWRFIAPRLVPAVLAFVGMLGVLAAMDLMASRCRLEPRGSATIYLVDDVEDAARL